MGNLSKKRKSCKVNALKGSMAARNKRNARANNNNNINVPPLVNTVAIFNNIVNALLPVIIAVPAIPSPIIEPTTNDPNNSTVASTPNIEALTTLVNNPINSYHHEVPRRSTRPRKPIGIINGGYYCYQNALIQCLYHITPLKEWFLYNEEYNILIKENKGNIDEGINLVKQLKLILDKLSNTTCHEPLDTFSTKNFRKLLGKINIDYKSDVQHDIHEFLNFFLQNLCSSLNRVKVQPTLIVEIPIGDGSNDLEISSNTWNIQSLNENSIIRDIFGGQLRSERSLKCADCNNKTRSVSFEYFQTIEISIPLTNNNSSEKIPIYDCLKDYIKEEVLNDNNHTWVCLTCNTSKSANYCKKITLYKFPKVLILVIKRFKYSSLFNISTKIDKIVDFPLEELNMNLTYYGDESVDGESLPIMYDLFAVSNHIGTSTNSGHYTAYAKDLWNNNSTSESKWYEFNDDKVTEINDKNNVVTKDAYILFYKQQ